ncbi:MAG: efflux RND transporter periplasmic adaptor subunit [Syntrophomonadaceae bacterium]|nr:efflux RND transporter periplasmic adaptor subunit [Syntrophomonadaceae bacterium]
MSETPINTAETENAPDVTAAASSRSKIEQLEAANVKKVLLKKRISGMSRRAKIIWAVVLLLLVGATGFGIHKYWGGKATVEYSTAAVTKGTVTDYIEATGTLGAVKTTEMGFKNDDTIIALNVQPGDHVKAGQVLAEQDPATLTTALRQAQSTVEQDAVNVKSANLTNDTNRKTLERQQQLFDAGAVTQSDLETAQNNYAKSQWDLETAQSKLANDQAKLEQAQTDLSGATMVAPYDGIIGVVNGQVGSINGINSSSSTLLTIMSEELQLSSLVNEADIGRVKVGQEVEFTSSSFSNRTFTGKVVRITPQATTVSNVQYYPALISVDDPDKVLMSGMSVSANIIVSRTTDTVLVPMMAVSYAETYVKSNPSSASGGDGQAVVVMENNQPVVRQVNLGINDGANYAVSEGLKEGDRVIVGTNKTGSSNGSGNSSTSNTRSNSNSNSNRTPTGGGGGMGGPPPGF